MLYPLDDQAAVSQLLHILNLISTSINIVFIYILQLMKTDWSIWVSIHQAVILHAVRLYYCVQGERFPNIMQANT